MSSNLQGGKISVTLPADLAGFVQGQTDSGKYASANEVIREALRLFEAAEQIHTQRFQEVKSKIAAGLASLDRGDSLDGETVFHELEVSLLPSRKKNARR